MFNWSIIQSLRLLKSLKTLSLTDNRLEVSFPVEGMPIHHNTYNSYFSLFFFFFGRTFGLRRLGDIGFKQQSTQWLPHSSR